MNDTSLHPSNGSTDAGFKLGGGGVCGGDGARSQDGDVNAGYMRDRAPAPYQLTVMMH